MKMTWDELMVAPEGTPEWFVKMVSGIKVADHLGDVWDDLIHHAPTPEVSAWVKKVAFAEYVEDDRFDDSTYEVEE